VVPTHNSVSTETGLPVKWGPDEKYRVEAGDARLERVDAHHLGRSHFSQRRGRRRQALSMGRAAARKAGSAEPKVLWKKELGDGDHKERKQNMSSPSPVTDGKFVWALTGTGSLKCFDFAGNEKWARDIQKDYGKFGLNWGYASSPTLYEDSIFVQVLHGMKTEGFAVPAADRQTDRQDAVAHRAARRRRFANRPIRTARRWSRRRPTECS
jgi:hypothetical protein